MKKSDILNAFNSRHACKVFDSEKKISEEDFKFILETGRLSPSSFGFEPWKFLVVQSEELRTKMKEFAWGAQNQLPTASHFIVLLSRKSSSLKYDASYIYDFMKNIQKLPDDIVKMKGDFYKKFQTDDFKLLESKDTLEQWAHRQTYIALGNMMTSAALIGIDSCPIEGFDLEKTESLLASENILDRNEFGVSCMLALGYRAENPSREKTRQSIDAISIWK